MRSTSTLLILLVPLLLGTLNGYSQTIVTVGTGTTATTLTSETPFGTLYEDGRMALLYTASEIISNGGYPGEISAVGYNVASVGSPAMSSFNVKIGTTSQTSLSGYISSMTTVYTSASYTPTTGWNTFTFNSPFARNGTDNIVVEICWDNTSWSSSSQVYYTTTTNNMVYHNYNDGNSGCTMTGGNTYNSTHRANVQFTLLPPDLTAITQDTVWVGCNGDSSATVAAVVVGGTSPYSFQWSNGSTDSALYNMPAGSYSVIVTDNASDMDTGYIVVAEPEAIVSSASVTMQLVCNYDTSQAVVIGSGGTPFTGYFIDTTSSNYNPDTSQLGTTVSLGDDAQSSALPIGFEFVFFDNPFTEFYIGSNGYITFTSAGSAYEQQLPNPTTPNNVIALAWEDLYPPQGGTISYFTTGTAPYRKLVVSFIDVPYWPNSSADVTVQAILYETTNCIEIHTTYAGFSGSAQEETQGIENEDGTQAFVYPGRNYAYWSAQGSYISFCPVDSTGLSYEWSNGMTGSPVNGLLPGTYTVTVSDLNGCFNTHEVQINQPVSDLTSSVTSTDVTCFAANDATIDPGITGGVAPYTYTWTNTSQTSATVSNLGPGTYAVSAEDNVGCTIQVNDIVIWEPPLLQAVVNNIQNVVCPGDTTGSASAVAAGGVQPYTFSWLPVGVGGQMATGLSDGTYNLVVTDANGCHSYASVAILATSTLPSIDLGPDIFDPNGGTATLDAGNHTSYLWNNNSTASTLTVTQTGTYWVEVSNNDGCTSADTIYIEIWPTGINELDQATGGIKIYPNPAQNFLQFEMNPEITSVSVALIDAKGSTVLRTRLLNDGLTTLDVSALPNGIYSMNIVNGQSVSTHRLVIAR